MATTGFWPVKGSLKVVIDYADNPDKTTNPKYLDDDLARVLEYAGNDEKTDRRLFISGVNCSADRACEEMRAIQKRFGMRGTNVAYHGYQSFRPGEVTPEEAHRIGIETARRMWGDRYQVVVTTHLNTDSVHNHMVVNAVSFRDGKKFQNHVSDHHRLREISDAVCREHELSVLEGSDFYGGKKGAYWVHKQGGMTHRDMLKQDIEDSLKYAMNFEGMVKQLRAKGYIYDYRRGSVKAPGWERAIRLDRLGYTREVIRERTNRNLDDPAARYGWNTHLPYRPKRFPLLELERQLEFTIEHSRDTATVLIDTLFLILLTLLQLTRDEREERQSSRPLSPTVRMELARFDRTHAQYMLLRENDIHTAEELGAFMRKRQGEITVLEKERQSCRNWLRRPKDPQVERDLKERIHSISEQLKPLRKDLADAGRIDDSWRRYYELLQSEHDLEAQAHTRERSMER